MSRFRRAAHAVIAVALTVFAVLYAAAAPPAAAATAAAVPPGDVLTAEVVADAVAFAFSCSEGSQDPDECGVLDPAGTPGTLCFDCDCPGGGWYWICLDGQTGEVNCEE